MTRRTFFYSLLVAVFVIALQLLAVWGPDGFFSKNVEMTIACSVGGLLLFILGATSVLSK